MSNDQNGFKTPLDEGTRARLNSLRNELLKLHKVLLESERATYEKSHGPIGSSTEFLRLLMSDPWFDWLRRISELVVHIDERLESDDVTFDDAFVLFDSARVLFQPKPAGPDLEPKTEPKTEASGNIAKPELEPETSEQVQEAPETEFMRRYKLVLQRDPGAVIAHAEVQRALLSES